VATTGLSARQDGFAASIVIMSGKSLSAAADPSVVLHAMEMNFTASGKT
jgi:hypothetical protein